MCNVHTGTVYVWMIRVLNITTTLLLEFVMLTIFITGIVVNFLHIHTYSHPPLLILLLSHPCPLLLPISHPYPPPPQSCFLLSLLPTSLRCFLGTVTRYMNNLSLSIVGLWT